MGKFHKNGLLIYFRFFLQLCSDANKTATSSSHQDSEYDTASDSQSSDEAEPLHKPVEPVGDSGGGDAIQEDLTDLVDAKTSIMQLGDGIPIEESRKLSREESDDIHDADGEADDDEERWTMIRNNYTIDVTTLND